MAWREPTARIRSYNTTTYVHTAYLAERQVCQAAMETNGHFVRSFEGGHNDGGLLQSRQTVQGSATERLFAAMDMDDGKAQVLPIEVKCPTARADDKSNIYWTVDFRHSQFSTCQIVIVSSIVERGFVAVFPMEIIRERIPKIEHGHPGNRKIRYMSASFRVMWQLHSIPAFPPEWAPFILPMPALGSALARIRAGTLTDTGSPVAGTWFNEYTGVSMTGLTPLRYQSIETLEPGFRPWRDALTIVKRFFKAFRACSGEYRVELVGVAPLLGDMKLVHLETEMEIIIECKDKHCEIIPSDAHSIIHHAQSCLGFTGKGIFTWKAQWDWIFTTIGAERALFLPRDNIPLEWWNAPMDGTSTHPKLQWRLHQDRLREYTIDLTSDDQLVSDIERALDAYAVKGHSVKAQKPIPIGLISEDPEDPEDGDTEGFTSVGGLAAGDKGGPAALSAKDWSTSHYRRGFGSTAHPELRGPTYEAWASEALLEICRHAGNGLVLDLGIYNTSCRYVITPYVWSHQDMKDYDLHGNPPRRTYHFHKKTPVVPLSFIRLHWQKSWHPHSTSNCRWMAPKIEQRRPSLVICDTYPYECIRLPHNRFLIPSEELLPDIPLWASHFFRDEGSIDRFSVDRDQLVDTLMAVFYGGSSVSFGLGCRSITSSRYCCCLETILKEGVDSFRWGREAGEDDDDDDRSMR